MNALIRLSYCLLLISFGANAQESKDRPSTGELALSNDTLELRYIGGGEQVGVGGSAAVTGAFFLSEDRDIVLSGGLLWPANLDLGPVSLMFGPQLYAALLEEENSDVFSITVGAQARFLINRNTGFAIVGRAFYGPDILTFGTADNLTDLSARVEINAGSSVLVFGGMRWFEFDLTEGEGEQTLMEEVFVGVGYRF